MVSLEQVKLLEAKVAKAIDFVKTLSEENSVLRGKLDGYRRRIDELEVLVKAFKEDQGRIEEGIMSALERLNQFEDAVERGFAEEQETAEATEGPEASAQDAVTASPEEAPAASGDAEPEADSDEAILAELEAEEAAARAAAARSAELRGGGEQDSPSAPDAGETRAEQGGELDIF